MDLNLQSYLHFSTPSVFDDELIASDINQIYNARLVAERQAFRERGVRLIASCFVAIVLYLSMVRLVGFVSNFSFIVDRLFYIWILSALASFVFFILFKKLPYKKQGSNKQTKLQSAILEAQLLEDAFLKKHGMSALKNQTMDLPPLVRDKGLPSKYLYATDLQKHPKQNAQLYYA